MRPIVEKRIAQRLRRAGPLAAVLLLAAAACITSGCAMLRRRAAERPPFRRVSPPIAFEMMRDTPALLILDLRPAEAFHGDTGHIYRAFNIPEDRLPFRLLELSSFREETFLVYCDTVPCGEDGMAVLVSSGFESAVLIDGGIDNWIAKGFRTVLPAELAGKSRQQAAQRESEATESARAPGVPMAQPAICPEPHVPVQKPPV